MTTPEWTKMRKLIDLGEPYIKMREKMYQEINVRCLFPDKDETAKKLAMYEILSEDDAWKIHYDFFQMMRPRYKNQCFT